MILCPFIALRKWYLQQVTIIRSSCWKGNHQVFSCLVIRLTFLKNIHFRSQQWQSTSIVLSTTTKNLYVTLCSLRILGGLWEIFITEFLFEVVLEKASARILYSSSHDGNGIEWQTEWWNCKIQLQRCNIYIYCRDNKTKCLELFCKIFNWTNYIFNKKTIF